jgi:hypothetical protein
MAPGIAVDAAEQVSTALAHRAAGAETRTSRRARRASVSERRAHLVVQCACDLLGIDPASAARDLQLALSVQEFESELRRRYATTHPELIYRTDSTLERARLERARLPWLPRVILRRGAPPRGAKAG